jgi:hypothetical protein
MFQRYLQAAILSGVFLLAIPSAAMAQFYGGLEGDRYSITLKSTASQVYPQATAGEDLHLGYRWRNFAGEAGFGTSAYTSDGNFDNMHLTRATLDGFYYLPVFGGLNILFTAGGSEINYGISTDVRIYTTALGVTHVSNGDQTVLHGDEFDWRAGGGFSFGFDEFELRVLGRYQPLSMGNTASNALSIDFGINVYF